MNNNRAVITLPIGIYENFKTGLLLVPTLLEVIKNKISAKGYLALNILDSTQSREDYFDSFMDNLEKMEFDIDENWIDKDNLESLLRDIYQLIEKGYIKEKELEKISCECGIVDMNKKGVRFENNSKNYSMINGEMHCNACNGICKDVVEKVLVFEVPDIDDGFQIVPKFLNKDINTMRNVFCGSDLIISRKRDTGVQINYGDTTYNIDIDFVWLNFLSLFKEDQRVIVGSNHHLYQMFMINLLEKCKDPNKKDTVFVAIPYVINNLDFNVEESIKDMSPTAKKTYFASLMKWNPKNTKWSKESCNYIKKLQQRKQEQLYKIFNAKEIQGNSQDFYEFVNSAVTGINIQKHIEKLKSQKNLDKKIDVGSKLELEL